MLRKNNRVYVYRNLHKGCFSVRQEGKVIDHVKSITLRCARFLVGKKGREKVLRECRKNVHAGISGYVIDPQSVRGILGSLTPHKVMYNPYEYETFVKAEDFSPVKKSGYAVLSMEHGVFLFG